MDDPKQSGSGIWGYLWLAVGVAAVNRACSSLDDTEGSFGSTSSIDVTSWGDGAGGRIEVRGDGAVFQRGEFIGHRDSNGRIIDGSGNLLGTLKNTGEFYGANGAYERRFFR